MRASLLAPFLAATVLMVTPTPAADNALSGDLGRLQGRWSAQAGPRRNIAVELEIAGRQAQVRIVTPQGLKFNVQGEIKIDETAQPRALDWVNFNGLDDQELPDILAIYRLEGDTLQVCNGGPNNNRPTEFKPGDGVLADLVVFARTK